MAGRARFPNAVVDGRDLPPVAAIRLGLPASASRPPFVDWPEDLAAIVRGDAVMLEGGHEVDGRPIVPFDTTGMRAPGRRTRAAGPTAGGVTALFPPLSPSRRGAAAAVLRGRGPGPARRPAP